MDSNSIKRQTILIVDDEPISLLILEELLKSDYNVKMACNGKEALVISRWSPSPDLILLDVVMPDIDGYEVCRALKADDKMCRIPIIFLTSSATIEDERYGLELGAVDFITKPISPPIVLARVRNHLKQKNAFDISCDQLASTLEVIPDILFEIDASGTYLQVHSSRDSQLAGPKHAILGKNVTDVLPAAAAEVLFEAIEAANLTGSDYGRTIMLPLESGEHWFELSVARKISQLTESPHFIVLSRDITIRKKALADLEAKHEELKMSQSRVIQQEKMAAIGQMAAGVAHEINNPMGFITSNLNTLIKYIDRTRSYQQALRDQLSDRQCECSTDLEDISRRLKIDRILDDADNLVKESLEGAERVRKIVQDLKSFSHVDDADVKNTDINQCLETTINMVWSEIKYVAKLTKELGDIPFIKCHPQQLNQVFMNLLVNAAHAITGYGEITVRSWSDDNNIYVSISDTGSGIPDEIKSHIFEPFFTTKEVGKGTGLGLSISFDIVKKHQGEIKLDSIVGQGTTFTVCLPLHALDEC